MRGPHPRGTFTIQKSSAHAPSFPLFHRAVPLAHGLFHARSAQFAAWSICGCGIHGGRGSVAQQALTFFHPLPEAVEHPAGPDTPEKVALGNKLFLDPQLSEDGTISCNSCHKLDHYGVDNSPTSIGVRGQHGGRNSPTVFNAALRTTCSSGTGEQRTWSSRPECRCSIRLRWPSHRKHSSSSG